MGAKIHDMGSNERGKVYAFHCPGCQYGHAFEVPRWTWNGSFDKPTFTPSLLVNNSEPATRCHSVVTDGMIQFQNDCWHSLAGQNVELPDWNSE